RYDTAMRSAPAQAGVPFCRLLERAVALHGAILGPVPALSAGQREALPAFHVWHDNAATIERFRDHLEAAQADGVLPHHPLSRLHSRFGKIDQPLQTIHAALRNVESVIANLLDRLQGLDLLA